MPFIPLLGPLTELTGLFLFRSSSSTFYLELLRDTLPAADERGNAGARASE